MDKFNPQYVKNKIDQNIDKLMSLNCISDECKIQLKKLKDTVTRIVSDEIKQFDSFEQEYETPLEEEQSINKFTFSMIHLITYLKELLQLHEVLISKQISKTDKLTQINRSISNISCPDDILTEPITDVFGNIDNIDDDEY